MLEKHGLEIKEDKTNEHSNKKSDAGDSDISPEDDPRYELVMIPQPTGPPKAKLKWIGQ